MDAGKKKIWIRGQFIEVTDEVYTAYMKGNRKIRYFENDLKTERTVKDRAFKRDYISRRLWGYCRDH